MIVDEGFFQCFLVWVVYLVSDGHISFNMAYQSLLSFRWRGWWDAAFLCKTGREKASWELTALGLLVELEH